MENLELFFDDHDDGLIPIYLDGIPDPPQMENIHPGANAVSPSESGGSWIDQIEKMLMEEEEEDGDDGLGEACEIFLADWIVDSPTEGGSGSGSGSGEVVDASSCDVKVGDSDEEVEDKAIGGRGTDQDDEEDEDSEAVGDGGSDDPLSKKKKRQLRNRDAAARSRDRKKVYVKELEMKSKYLESECLRLGRMLQCVVAENQALRFSLQNGSSAYGASATKQESAVLLLESLLLGSLLWSLVIMCLPLSIQPVLDVLENVRKREAEPPAPRGAKIEKLRLFNAGSFLTSRKCKASRTKIKPNLLAAQFLH